MLSGSAPNRVARTTSVLYTTVRLIVGFEFADATELCCLSIGEQLLDVLMENTPIPLERQDVIGFRFATVFRNPCRTAIGVGGHGRALNIQHRKQFTGRCNLAWSAVDCTLSQQKLLVDQPDVQQVKRPSFLRPAWRHPEGSFRQWRSSCLPSCR
jgi:predicted RNase H-like nuclease